MVRDVNAIIIAIDDYLEKNHLDTCTPPEIGLELERLGLLNDRVNRRGNYVRKLLRESLIPHAYQDGSGYWHIPHSKR